MTMALTPARELIESKAISEGKHYDFKREIDLDKKHPNGGKSGKERFLDDIVAFLNGGHGHIIVGVNEADGVWQSYQPMSGNREKLCNRIEMVILDNIKPAPTKIAVIPIDVDDGFILDIQVPDHWKKPYQNGMSGAFYTRSGARNRILTVGEIQELFAENEKMEADLAKIYAEFDRDLRFQDMASRVPLATSSPWASGGGRSEYPPRLQFGILPRQHFDRHRPPYNPRKMVSSVVYSFDGGLLPRFKGCSEGFEAVSSHERVFLGTDWRVLGWVDHPLDVQFGKPNIEELGIKLRAYLHSIGEFLSSEGIVGPFSIILDMENLDELEGWSRPGMSSSVGGGRPRIVEQLDDEAVLRCFIEQVRSGLFG
ncbi:putative DNA-binding protein [Rhizobium sp. PP-F2F-G36]|nr:putative DNA-binding protein [Rhizobium sp. PP-F2F-G36]